MKEIIDSIFNNVNYWQDKRLLLQAINPDYYRNKNIILRLLKVSSASISISNEAKKEMWNYQLLHHNMGDDILKNVDPQILADKEFAKLAIEKYNRTYLFLSKELRSSKDLALTAAIRETNETKNPPILKFMPQAFQLDSEIALMATTRNINNLEYAPNLRRNKYFIIDIMNFTQDFDTKQKILKLVDQNLLQDKKFVSQLGCFDNMCENYRGDKEFVSSAVRYDLDILRKTELFDESIIKGALKNNDYKRQKDVVLSEVFRYIERFNGNFEELDAKIKDKQLLHRLFWEFGELVSDGFH
ncbi:MAG: DUF4116 domain-containing protein [Campylobacterales bacterium]|nr:DUF4116 domain-containing protein [Campylobacterales bacterium]